MAQTRQILRKRCPPDNKDLTGVYARFAKEGAKLHIGMVYSTQ